MGRMTIYMKDESKAIIEKYKDRLGGVAETIRHALALMDKTYQAIDTGKTYQPEMAKITKISL